MSDRKTRKREAPISYRPPQAIRDEFYRRAENSGLSLSGFITSSVFGNEAPRQTRNVPVEKRDLVRLLAQCAAIHDQLARFELAGKTDSDIRAAVEAAHRELGTLRAACFKALGRTP